MSSLDSTEVLQALSTRLSQCQSNSLQLKMTSSLIIASAFIFGLAGNGVVATLWLLVPLMLLALLDASVQSQAAILSHSISLGAEKNGSLSKACLAALTGPATPAGKANVLTGLFTIRVGLFHLVVIAALITCVIMTPAGMRNAPPFVRASPSRIEAGNRPAPAPIPSRSLPTPPQAPAGRAPLPPKTRHETYPGVLSGPRPMGVPRRNAHGPVDAGSPDPLGQAFPAVPAASATAPSAAGNAAPLPADAPEKARPVDEKE